MTEWMMADAEGGFAEGIDFEVADLARQREGEEAVSGYPEGTRLWVADMGPVERAYAEAMHEDCTDGEPHPLTAHEPWSGGDLDGVEPWPTFTARLFRHGLTLTLDPDRSTALRSPLTDTACGDLWTAAVHLLEAWPNLVNHPSMNPSEIVALRDSVKGKRL